MNKKRLCIKKIIACFVVLTMMFINSALLFNAYANSKDDDYLLSYLNLSSNTVEALLEVSPEEWQAYLTAYKLENNIIEITDNDYIGSSAEVQWKSGKDEENGATHAYVTFWAMTVMLNEKGFWQGSLSDMVKEIAAVAVASEKPDRGILAWGVGYSDHFYDPDTGKNYLGQTSPTAKTNAAAGFMDAINNEKAKKHQAALESLGEALHFLQDACEPHHASNHTGTIPTSKSAHVQFELYAEQQLQNEDIILVTEVPSSIYNYAYSHDTEDLVHASAKIAKSHINSVISVNDKSKWHNTAEACLNLSMQRSAALIYKFAKQTGLI